MTVIFTVNLSVDSSIQTLLMMDRIHVNVYRIIGLYAPLIDINTHDVYQYSDAPHSDSWQCRKQNKVL